jgi:hypothetical protein
MHETAYLFVAVALSAANKNTGVKSKTQDKLIHRSTFVGLGHNCKTTVESMNRSSLAPKSSIPPKRRAELNVQEKLFNRLGPFTGTGRSMDDNFVRGLLPDLAQHLPQTSSEESKGNSLGHIKKVAELFSNTVAQPCLADDEEEEEAEQDTDGDSQILHIGTFKVTPEYRYISTYDVSERTGFILTYRSHEYEYIPM